MNTPLLLTPINPAQEYFGDDHIVYLYKFEMTYRRVWIGSYARCAASGLIWYPVQSIATYDPHEMIISCINKTEEPEMNTLGYILDLDPEHIDLEPVLEQSEFKAYLTRAPFGVVINEQEEIIRSKHFRALHPKFLIGLSQMEARKNAKHVMAKLKTTPKRLLCTESLDQPSAKRQRKNL